MSLSHNLHLSGGFSLLSYKISRSPYVGAIHRISVFSHRPIRIRKKLIYNWGSILLLIGQEKKKRKISGYLRSNFTVFDCHLLIQLMFSLFLYSLEKKRNPLLPTFLRCCNQATTEFHQTRFIRRVHK